MGCSGRTYRSHFVSGDFFVGNCPIKCPRNGPAELLIFELLPGKRYWGIAIEFAAGDLRMSFVEIRRLPF